MLASELLKIENNDATLMTLDLSLQPLKSVDFENLAKALAKNTRLKTLNLESTEMTNIGLQQLASTFQGRSGIEHLNLGKNPAISHEGLRHLFAMLKINRNLEKLDISHLTLDERSQEALCDALFHNFSLKEVLVEPQYQELVQHFLERNAKRHLYRKAPFICELLEGDFTVNKAMVADLLKKMILNPLDEHIASEKKSQPGLSENLQTISGFLDQYVAFLDDNQLADLMAFFAENNPEHRLTKAHFINYLLDCDEIKFQEMLQKLIQTLMPGTSPCQIRLCMSKFIELAYDFVVYNHRTELIRQWLPKFFDNEPPLPTDQQALQTLLEDALRRAAANGDVVSISLLVTYVNNPNATDEQGISALDFAEVYAMHTGDEEASRIIFQFKGRTKFVENQARLEEAWKALLIKHVPALTLKRIEEEPETKVAEASDPEVVLRAMTSHRNRHFQPAHPGKVIKEAFEKNCTLM